MPTTRKCRAGQITGISFVLPGISSLRGHHVRFDRAEVNLGQNTHPGDLQPRQRDWDIHLIPECKVHGNRKVLCRIYFVKLKEQFGTHETYCYSCPESFCTAINSHTNCWACRLSSPTSGKKNPVVAIRSLGVYTLHWGAVFSLSPFFCHFFSGRAGFIGPGARNSFVQWIFEPTFDQTASVSGPERTKEDESPYIFMDSFRVEDDVREPVRFTMPVWRGCSSRNCVHLLHRYCTLATRLFIESLSVAAAPIVTAETAHGLWLLFIRPKRHTCRCPCCELWWVNGLTLFASKNQMSM